MLYDIQLPAIKALKEEGNRAVFTVEPLYPGYGMTLGNSLRRVILSSLGGAAVTAVKIDSVAHEFSTIKGVKEDVVEVILNLKKLRFQVYSDEPQYLILTKKGSGMVTGADIKTNADVEIVNPEQHIATIDSPSTQVGMEIKVEKGRGYIPVEAREHEKLEVGMIAVDAIYSPIKRVRYNVENTRVGQVTDLDRLVLEVETDGSISPREAVTQAAEILVQHFAVVSGQSAPEAAQNTSVVDDVTESNASRIMIEEVNFSPRTTNALMNNDIRTMKELLRLSNAELRELKGFGAQAYEEVKSKIAELGLIRETEEA